MNASRDVLCRRRDVEEALMRSLHRFYDEKMTDLAQLAKVMNEELSHIELFDPEMSAPTLEILGKRFREFVSGNVFRKND